MPEIRDRKNRLQGWRGAGDESHLSLTADQFRAVRDHYQAEAKKHHAVDQTVRTWARHYGAEILGYDPVTKKIDHSMKDMESLTRKVAQDLDGSTSTSAAKTAVRSMKDIHRYTFQWDADQYVDKAFEMFQYADSMNLQNYKQKHTWEKPTFKGLNWVVGRDTPPGSNQGSPNWSVESKDSLRLARRAMEADAREAAKYGVFVTDDGIKFEVQAHTFEGVAINKQTHAIYEAQRVADPKYTPAFDYMRYRAYVDNNVRIPPGIDRLPGNAGSASPPPVPPKNLYAYAAKAVQARGGRAPALPAAGGSIVDSMSTLSLNAHASGSAYGSNSGQPSYGSGPTQYSTYDAAFDGRNVVPLATHAASLPQPSYYAPQGGYTTLPQPQYYPPMPQQYYPTQQPQYSPAQPQYSQNSAYNYTQGPSSAQPTRGTDSYPRGYTPEPVKKQRRTQG